MYLDHNQLKSTDDYMTEFCNSIDRDAFTYFVVDEGVSCIDGCCSEICEAGDLDCNKSETLEKYDDEDFYSRDEYIFTDEINVDEDL
jgi:hypothetical protein